MLRMRAQSFTTGSKIATSGVLLKKIDNEKQVTNILSLPISTEPSEPKVFRATQSSVRK